LIIDLGTLFTLEDEVLYHWGFVFLTIGIQLMNDLEGIMKMR
jgi:hypothetical protein